MNKTIRSILTLTAFGAAALGLAAQPALKIVTVDMSKLLEGYYKTEDQVAKLKANEQKAQEELERMAKEGNALAEQYKETAEQAKNTLLTAEARAKAETDSAKMLEELQRRQNDINTFRGKSQQVLQGQLNNIRSQLLDEISKRATDLAKGKGATLVVDKSGQTIIGIPVVLFSDAAYDLTDEVMAEINKDRPAPPAAAAPTGTTPAATPPAAAPAKSPSVTVPGLAPKK
jgi:outer membrane protein